jgi:RimJ/RimL family protein N-acetyltransferase
MSLTQTHRDLGLSRTLHNEFVTLVPVAEEHRIALQEAGSDPAIWALQPFNIAEGFDVYFDWLLAEQASGRWIPFVVKDPRGKVIGQTCYVEFRYKDHGLEIGGTWYSPDVQGTAINPASKLLLLENAFSAGMVRVQLKTDCLNTRSQAAIQKLGAKFEGVFRKHKLRPDGTWRDSVYYSITDDEWPTVREGLRTRLYPADAIVS